MKKLLLLSFSALLLASCSEIAGKYGRAACNCSVDMKNLYDQDMKDPGSVSDELFNEVSGNFEKCMKEANKRYSDLITEDQAKKAIEENCPDTYNSIFQGGK